MPGPYTDHHVHLLSTAAARLSVDVASAASFAEMGQVLRGAPVSGTGWVRAWGYEEWALAEGRHPDRSDVDAMLAGRPLVLHHRSGHAAVLNSVALAEVGQTDHADGILFDRHDLLARVPRLDPVALEAAATAVSRAWAAAGVVAFTDATHTNGPEELETLARWCSAGAVSQRVTAMVGPAAPGTVPAYGESIGAVRIGPVKIMPGHDDGAHDDGARGGLAAAVEAAHRAGYPVAVHVMDVGVLDATLAAFERSDPPPGAADRIEHNALCLPEQVERIAASGSIVVVNPSFLIHRAGKYRRQLTRVEQGWLIRIASLLRAGIEVRAGSDSPVAPSVPEEMVRAASAHPFTEAESVTVDEAERLLGE